MQEKLIQQLKKEVKQIVEEAVTRKFIHADSTSITSLCAVVDAVIKDGSKRRAGGILPPYDTETLLLKLCEVSEATRVLVRKLSGTEPDDAFEVHKPSPGPEDDIKKTEVKVKKLNLDQCKLSYGKNIKFLWIRVALVEKLLAKILGSLVEHADKFYEPTAILADPVNGPLVANLLAGPCALDYSKMKTPDGRWSDPSADELVQRHRIHSGLSLRRRQTSFDKPQLSSTSPLPEEFVVAPSLAREHVESLHQNASANMLFGKNNVEVQPASGSDWVPGYLSLHQTAESLLVKWTPNDLMSGSPDEHQMLQHSNQAITIDTLDVVYVHCHHRGEAERVMVLIAQDGVQRPPIRFPTTGSLMRFLECLETGLVPYGRLDPPLANDTGGGETLFDKHEGKIVKQSLTRDYVFRLVPSISPEDIGFDSDLNLWATSKTKTRKKKKLRKLADRPKTRPPPQRLVKKRGTEMTRACLESVCHTMKHQIMYRALKGWLSHVRHLSTVRNHLSSLVQPTVVAVDDVTSKGLTREKWSELYRAGKLCSDEDEIAKLVYHGGVEHDLRHLVWPYLLGYHAYGSTPEEREHEDNARAFEYKRILAEWTNVEILIRQRTRVSETDRDSTASSAGSKDEFNETPEHDTHDTKNNIESPDSGNVSNGKLTNGYQDNGTPEEHYSGCNGTPGEDDREETNPEVNSPKSELDDESGCYDCVEESVKVPISTYENGSSCEKCTLCGKSAGDYEDLTNGYHENGVDGDTDERQQCTCKDGRSSRLSSYSDDLLDNFALNIHRIDKDVLRCDRNYPYFSQPNLEKLRRIMCTYVWTTLEVGYVQGMCDLLAPLLVIFDDEAKSYHCFVLLMKRMDHNFPHGENMDKYFVNMRSLIQILDPELFEVMQQNGDLTHCYFCYRWFLLDFKREFLYEDIFRVWECIWSARICSSKHFVLFIALALLKSYRNILIDHSMDFTDIIKFFNEMAEGHNATQILDLARSSVENVTRLIQNE
ncbi:small G protein signaling modulator 1-like [Dendronephthya gigantea]|uniref:small G protein signaling modulator 1-like n=1 Tax=Dendronephthya gigantea TaxID=151771 RepID=UPI00106C343A|nr:small G protein signaling modulator 1-like [Dendronephthya gigantea]